ncbi:unnamed protein product [Staurois parvus]|uniref:Uncharacterized protein n=1 Tax=Staurois parvus TaxID=386267 RepID=A0ABN9AC79_9NEOB|nr:unnamed protein product [Staurois parvus]
MTDPDPSGMDGQLSGVGERGTGGVSENGRGHKPGSAGSGQRGTEGQAEGWSGTSRGQSRRGSA